MNIVDGVEIIKTAYKKHTEEQLWQQWLVDYEKMDIENFMSFEDYKKKALGIKVKTEKVDIKKIIEESEKIKNADQRGGVN